MVKKRLDEEDKKLKEDLTLSAVTTKPVNSQSLTP